MADTNDESVSAESSSATPSRVYGDMLDIMDRASKHLRLDWSRELPKPARGHLYECFLAGLDRPAPRSLPFLPNFHSEISRSWGKPYSYRPHLFQYADNVNVEGAAKRGYMKMPPVEETFARYLSQGESSSLKAPAMVCKAPPS